VITVASAGTNGREGSRYENPHEEPHAESARATASGQPRKNEAPRPLAGSAVRRRAVRLQRRRADRGTSVRRRAATLRRGCLDLSAPLGRRSRYQPIRHLGRGDANGCRDNHGELESGLRRSEHRGPGHERHHRLGTAAGERECRLWLRWANPHHAGLRTIEWTGDRVVAAHRRQCRGQDGRRNRQHDSTRVRPAHRVGESAIRADRPDGQHRPGAAATA